MSIGGDGYAVKSLILWFFASVDQIEKIRIV
jgi:hypothetical protein